MAGPFYNPAQAEGEREYYLALAASIVQDLAPAPSPLPTPDTYSPRAARAERLMLAYLTSTKGGTLTAKGGIPGATGSKSFARMPEVQGIVGTAMGGFYVGDRGGAFNLEVASTFPDNNGGDLV